MSVEPKVTLADLKANPPRFSPGPARPPRCHDRRKHRYDGGRGDAGTPTWTKDQLKRAIFARSLCESMGLTQGRFAQHYLVNAARIRDREQARSRSDVVAEAYTAVIRHDPATVDAALANALPPTPAAKSS